jgi:uncharacterized membrane protein
MNSTITMASEVNLEYILPPIGLAVFLMYMTSYFVLLWRYPLRLNLGLKMAVRRRWAAHVVHDNQALIAVQTLRNSQLASGVFASAAVIVAFFAFQQGATLAGSGHSFQGIKFYCLGATLVAAFIVFGISIRESEQCGYLSFAKALPKEWNEIEVPLVPRSMESNAALRREMTIANPEARGLLAGSAVAHSVFYWALGLRFFYLGVCIGGWIASPIACLIVTVVMVSVMYFWDRSVSSAMERSL